MRKAVVPVEDGVFRIETFYREDILKNYRYEMHELKLTKEDIETMAKAYEFALDNRMNNVEAMAEAAGSIGFEVED